MKLQKIGLILASALLTLVLNTCADTPAGPAPSTDKSITAFAFANPIAAGIISEADHTINITVPFGTNVSALVPVFTQTGKSISPVLGTAANFSSPVRYTVTAEDDSTQSYVATVSVAPAPTTSLDLSSLTVSSGALTPTFDPATTSYTLSVGNTVSSLSISAIKADISTTISYSPSQYPGLTVGANTVIVTVTGATGASKAYTIAVTRASSLDYVSPNIGTLKYVPAGTFQRDATATNLSTVSAFRMAATEVTRAQFVAVTGLADPSLLGFSLTSNDPVHNVNWYHALVFCNRLSAIEGLTPVYTIAGSINPTNWAVVPMTTNATWDAATVNESANGYRLPTEMEWMWAAMGASDGATGYTKAFAGSTGSNSIADYAWTSENSGNTSHPVGTKLPNELGLYDMSGNVWEWNWDWYGAYPTGAVTNYQGVAPSGNRVMRGGSWNVSAVGAALAYRGNDIPYSVLTRYGFRVVRP